MAATQIAALGATLKHFEMSERAALAQRLEATTLAMERARMEAEDLRGAAVSPHPAGLRGPPYLTWREFGEERNQYTSRLHEEVIEPTIELLRDARAELLALEWQPPRRLAPYRTAIEDAGDRFNDAVRQLREGVPP